MRKPLHHAHNQRLKVANVVLYCRLKKEKEGQLSVCLMYVYMCTCTHACLCVCMHACTGVWCMCEVHTTKQLTTGLTGFTTRVRRPDKVRLRERERKCLESGIQKMAHFLGREGEEWEEGEWCGWGGGPSNQCSMAARGCDRVASMRRGGKDEGREPLPERSQLVLNSTCITHWCVCCMKSYPLTAHQNRYM